MKTIISTFGEASEGVIQGIKQNGCEYLILLVPRILTEKAKENLRKSEILAKQMQIQVRKVTVSPYSLMENIQIIKQLIEDQTGNKVILNVTGGRKPLSLAATLAGFVAAPEKIIYIQEENDEPIEIPKFTIGEKFLSQEKRSILKCIKTDTKLEEIEKNLKKKNNGSKEYHTIMKHLRELAEMSLIKISEGRPHTYTITPSGELLR